MSYYFAQPMHEQPLTVRFGRLRLFNLVALERGLLFGVFWMLSVPLVYRGFLHVYTFDPFLLGLYLVWLTRRLHYRRSSVLKREGRIRAQVTLWEAGLLLFFLWTFISVLAAIVPLTSLTAWLLFIRGGLIYAYVRNNLGRTIGFADLRRIVVGLLMIQVVVGIAQIVTGSRIGSVNDYFGDVEEYANAYFVANGVKVPRIVGTFNNPNLLANWVVLLAPFIYISLFFRTARRRSLLYLLLAGCIVTLFYTYSRSGWISFLVGFFFVFMRITTKNARYFPRIILWAFALGVIAIIALVLMAIVNDSFPDIDLVESIVNRFSNVSGGASWRWAYMDLSLQLFGRNPVFGVGLDNFSEAILEYSGRLRIPSELAGSVRFTSVHNIYMVFFTETGLYGGILWLVLSAAMMLEIWLIYAHPIQPIPQFRTIVAWLIAAWGGFSFNSNFEIVFFHPSILMLVFVLLGVAGGLRNVSREARAIYGAYSA